MSKQCICGSSQLFDACCGPLLSGEKKAPTAERLMRSRFSAFATGNCEYLLQTWDPNTVPDSLELDPETTFESLHIVDTHKGGLFDDQGVVEFIARYDHDGTKGSQHERSFFRRLNGAWVYTSGIVNT